MAFSRTGNVFTTTGATVTGTVGALAWTAARGSRVNWKTAATMIPIAATTAIPEISLFLLDMRFAPEIVNLILFSASRTLAAINRNKRRPIPTGGAARDVLLRPVTGDLPALRPAA